MKKIALSALALLAVATLVVWAADISGTWTLSTPGPQGQMRERDITIKQEGTKITVTMPGRPGPNGEPGQPVVGEGTIEGNAIQWTIVRQTPRGEMKMEYKGTVDGATMKGTTTMMDRDIEWTAKKK